MEFISLLNPIELIKSFIKWIKKPNPVFSFEYMLSIKEENQYCQRRTIPSAKNLPGWFFRLGVNNKGKTPIIDANVLVEKIMKIDDK